jgi:hypothetical protein
VICITVSEFDEGYHELQIAFRDSEMIAGGEQHVANRQSNPFPRLWINYAYINREERDFSYLISQLKNASFEASYDAFQLMADTRLWERVVPRLTSIGFDGWLYILTHQCFTRRIFTDELTGAIDRITSRLGPEFPMIGLMHDIATQNVPAALRVRPCISLGDPEWKTQLSSALRNCSTYGNQRPIRGETRFIWKIHPCFGGDSSMTAVEVRPSKERIQYWRFAIPKSTHTARWGQGPTGGGEISRIRFAEARGSGRHENRDIVWFGAANTISDTESAYAVFLGPLPDFICFGPAKSPFGPPDSMEIIRPGLLTKTTGQTASWR